MPAWLPLQSAVLLGVRPDLAQLEILFFVRNLSDSSSVVLWYFKATLKTYFMSFVPLREQEEQLP